MNLAALLPRVQADAGYRAVVEQVRGATERNVRFSVLDAARPAALAALHGELSRPIILLVNRLARARQLVEEIAAWSASPDDIYLFPELDVLPYERLPLGGEVLHQRLRALLALGLRSPDLRPPFVVATARGAMDRVLAPDDARKWTRRIRVGEHMRPDELVGEWVETGYEPVPVVQGPGEFARRGGIIDVFPVGFRTPGQTAHSAYRIELWGNDVDSIRVFDPGTQRSTDPIDEILVGPAHEILPRLPDGAEDVLDRLDLRHLKSRVRDEVENEVRMLREGQSFPMLESFRGLLGTASILDYLPEDGLLISDEPGSIAATARDLHRQAEELAWDFRERGESPGGMPRPYWSWAGTRGQGGTERRGVSRRVANSLRHRVSTSCSILTRSRLSSAQLRCTTADSRSSSTVRRKAPVEP